MNKTFKEEQKFNAIWIWIILFFVVGSVSFGMYKEWQASELPSIRDMNLTHALVSVLFAMGICLWIFSLKLKTEVNHEGITVVYKPFINKTIHWTDIENVEVIDYGFVGGWGFRFSLKYGTVYNTRGKMGMALQHKTGKKLLIGTQRPEELKEVISNYKL